MTTLVERHYKHCKGMRNTLFEEAVVYLGKRLSTATRLTSIPSELESRRSAKVVRSSGVMRRCLKSFTSATLPNSPIIFRSNSGLSGNALKYKEMEHKVKV